MNSNKDKQLNKLNIFYLKNCTYNNRHSTWLGAVYLGYLGWLLGGGGALMLDLKADWNIGIAVLTFIFPLLAIISLVLNYVFKFRYYFLPSLVVLSISMCVSMTLAVLFNLVSLYFILPLTYWTVVTVLSIFSYYLVWNYNQQKTKPLTRHLMKLYNKDKLNLENIDPSKYVRHSPEWLSLLGYGLLFGTVLMAGTAFFGNKLNSDNTWVLPAIILSILILSVVLQTVSARWCGYIKPTIEVIKNLQVEDKLNNP